ncbi:EpsG family protein [Collinsella aerofaciens]|uniref:EpsG family protein n=1 Tax=Collinsella aerofaciens TaxID=74426 RepID=A0A6L8RIN1_9ACTN|nr:EpsG family protein [Collinsella aerofaciens]MZJ67655.1 hypothetical protein [Collinsella aerofaciens]MZJ85614.1 hypothetical protein [Collinsella aerofaciens]
MAGDRVVFPYIFVFVVSSVLFGAGWMIERSNRGRMIAWLFYWIAICIVCILAGARDLSIGTDTGGYGAFLYKQAMLSNSFASFYAVVKASIWDVAPLFACFSFVIVKLFHSQFALLFAIQFAVIAPVFLAAHRHRSRAFGWIMLLYLLAFYIPGLNTMRQSVAMGFVLLFVVSLMDGRYVLAVVMEIVALFTHSSAAIGLLFAVVWFSFFKKNESGLLVFRSWSQVIMLLSFFVIAIILVCFREIALLLSGVSGIGRLFLYGTHTGDPLSSTGALFILCLVVGAIFIAASFTSEKRVHGAYLTYLVSLSIPFFLMSGVDVTIARMSEYCLLLFIPLIGLVLSTKPNMKSWTGLILIGGGCAFRFFICFVYLGFNQAIPYTSTLLGIS